MLIVTWCSIIIAGFVFIFKFDQDVVVHVNYTLNSSKYMSNEVNLFALLNKSNITVECPDNFELKASRYILEIPYCDRWYPAGEASIVILNVGLSVLMLSGFITVSCLSSRS